MEKEIIEWKKSRSNYNELSPVLGRKLWRLFRRRWHHKSVSRRGQKFALKRNNSLTYHNTKKMYDDVYAALVDSGNARKSNEPSFAYEGPFITHNHLTHPQNCLVIDEVSSDNSHKGDGHAGGAKYFCDRGGTPYQQCAMNDKHFTMLGFTALSGEPVLCLIIIADVQEKFEVECGINIDTTAEGDPSDDDFSQKNCGEGMPFPMDQNACSMARLSHVW